MPSASSIFAACFVGAPSSESDIRRRVAESCAGVPRSVMNASAALIDWSETPKFSAAGMYPVDIADVMSCISMSPAPTAALTSAIVLLASRPRRPSAFIAEESAYVVESRSEPPIAAPCAAALRMSSSSRTFCARGSTASIEDATWYIPSESLIGTCPTAGDIARMPAPSACMFLVVTPACVCSFVSDDSNFTPQSAVSAAVPASTSAVLRPMCVSALPDFPNATAVRAAAASVSAAPVFAALAASVDALRCFVADASTTVAVFSLAACVEPAAASCSLADAFAESAAFFDAVAVCSAAAVCLAALEVALAAAALAASAAVP